LNELKKKKYKNRQKKKKKKMPQLRIIEKPRKDHHFEIGIQI